MNETINMNSDTNLLDKGKSCDITDDDKEKLVRLLQDLERYVEHYGVDPYQKYYVQLWKQNLVEILNGD